MKEIIKLPLITEKSTILRDKSNKYSFKVNIKANKIEIKKAIENIFKVKVKDVKTMIVLGKKKRVRYQWGKKPDWKKAIVTLASGNKIEGFGEE